MAREICRNVFLQETVERASFLRRQLGIPRPFSPNTATTMHDGLMPRRTATAALTLTDPKWNQERSARCAVLAGQVFDGRPSNE